MVKGDLDEATLAEDEISKVQIGYFKIGLVHGHQVVPVGNIESLGALARRLDVDILVTGHTGKVKTAEVEGRWIINPGSLTGSGKLKD